MYGDVGVIDDFARIIFVFFIETSMVYAPNNREARSFDEKVNFFAQSCGRYMISAHVRKITQWSYLPLYEPGLSFSTLGNKNIRMDLSNLHIVCFRIKIRLDLYILVFEYFLNILKYTIFETRYITPKNKIIFTKCKNVEYFLLLTY